MMISGDEFDAVVSTFASYWEGSGSNPSLDLSGVFCPCACAGFLQLFPTIQKHASNIDSKSECVCAETYDPAKHW